MNSTPAYRMNDHANFDADVALMGETGWGLYGQGFVDRIDHTTNPYGSSDNYESIYKFLYIPPVSGNYKFGTNSEAASEILKNAYDADTHTVINSWYGNHGIGAQIDDHSSYYSLTANQPVWLEYRQHAPVAVTQQSQMAIMVPGQAWKTMNNTNFAGAIFARQYATVEPTATVVEDAYLPTVGTITSNVLGDGTAKTWGAVAWDETLTEGTDVTVEIRTGGTATPDGSWSAWSYPRSVATGDIIPTGLSPSGYIQYRINLKSNGTGNRSPSVADITLYNTPLNFWDTTALADGQYTVRLLTSASTDADPANWWVADSVLEDEVTVTVENTSKPTSQIIVPNTSAETVTQTFTSNGTFVVPAGVSEVSVLVVAGGGGGANTGSGGGGGGYVYDSSVSVTSGSSYPVTVGAGGGGGAATGAPGTKGSNSVFSTITAEGGGAGYSHGNSSGGNGGSGGGAPIKPSAPAATPGTGSQGFSGGAGYVDAGWAGNNGGGGGAGSTGAAGGNTAGSGNGGNGLANSITGSLVTYAGGGGGGEVNGSFAGAGGSGGGGRANMNAAGTNGTNGLGGGGGGGGYNGTYFNGGTGGSGVIIVSYTYDPQIKTDGEITGTAADTFPGIGKVDVRIRRSGDDYYWNGSGWQLNEIWVETDSTGGNLSTWSYNSGTVTPAQDIFESGTTYTVSSRASDLANAVEDSPYDTKIFHGDSVVPDISIDFPTAPNDFLSADYVGLAGKMTETNLEGYTVSYQKLGDIEWTQVGTADRTATRNGFFQTTNADFNPTGGLFTPAAGFTNTRAVDDAVMLGREKPTGQYPNQASIDASFSAAGFNSSGSGVVATDGSYLYVKRYGGFAGPYRFTKVGTGYGGTVAGTNYGALSAGVSSDTISAFYYGGYVFNGYSVDGNTIERQNVTTGAISNVQLGGNSIVLPRGGSYHDWDGIHAGQGQTVIKDGATYKMWYAGHNGANWRIGYATSSDGVVWTKRPNPVLDLGGNNTWDDLHVYYPNVVKDGSTYKMWYTGHNGQNARIGYATSSDGINWTKNPNPVLDLGAGGAWDDNGILEASVIIENPTTYKMWYSGHDGSNWRIGYATSTDGITWAKSGSNPVVNLGTSGQYDSSHAYLPNVINDGGTYKMWYSMHNGNVRTGYATSADGITWSKVGMVTDLGSTGAFDATHVYSPAVIKDGATYKQWYAGHDGTRWAGIGYATSANGTTWTKAPTGANIGDRLMKRNGATDLLPGSSAADKNDILLTTDGRYVYNIAYVGTTNWKVRVFDPLNNWSKISEFTTVMDGFTAYNTSGFFADGVYIYPIESYSYSIGSPYNWGAGTWPGDNSRVTRIGTGLPGTGTIAGEIASQWYEGAYDEFQINGQYDPLNRKLWMGKLQGGTTIYRFNTPDVESTSGTYISNVFDMGPNPVIGTISWNQTLPGGTALTVATRVSSEKTFSTEDLTVTSDWQTATSGDNVPTPVPPVPNARYIQYRVTMTGPGGAVTPSLNDIAINYAPANKVLEVMPVVNMDEGQYTLKLSATDVAGNAPVDVTQTFYIDKTNPTGSLDALLNLDAHNTGYVSGASVGLNGDAIDLNMKTWIVQRKRAGALSWTPITTGAINVPGPSGSFGLWDTTAIVLPNNEDDQPYEVRLRITDKADNTVYRTPSPFETLTYNSVIIDNSAPVVTSTIPADTATNVDPNTNMTAVFDDPMYSGSISAATFLAGGGAYTPTSVTYQERVAEPKYFSTWVQDLLLFPFGKNSTVGAELTNGVHNRAGVPLVPYNWSFTTSQVESAVFQPQATPHISGQYPVMGKSIGDVFGGYKLEYKQGRWDVSDNTGWTQIGTDQTLQVTSKSNKQTDWSGGVLTTPVPFSSTTNPQDTTATQYYGKDANMVVNSGSNQLGTSNIRWLSNAWSTRQPVTVNNTANASALTDYQVKITVPFTAGMRTDFQDLRFTDADGETQLNYWIEKYTASSSAILWVKVPSIAASSNKTIYMYYGNSGATNGQNPSGTFDFFDGFDTGSGINTLKWSTGAGLGFTQATAKGQLKAVTTGGRLVSQATFGYPVTVEAKEMSAYQPPNGFAALGFYSAANRAFGILHLPGATYYYNDGTYIGVGNLMGEDTWYRLTVEPQTATRARYAILNDSSGAVLRDETVTNNVTGEKIMLGTRFDNTGSDPMSSSWDWVLARKYTPTAPTTSIGSADSYQNTGTVTSVVFDGGAQPNDNNWDWQMFSWTESTPRGTNITVQFRTGDNAAPPAGDAQGNTWSAYSAPVSHNGGSIIPAALRGHRYIQYRVNYYGNGASMYDGTIWTKPIITWDTTTVPGDGIYTLKLTTTDTAPAIPGAWDDSHTQKKAVFVNVDNAIPTINITDPVDDDFVTNMETVIGAATDLGASAKKIEFQADSGTWRAASGTSRVGEDGSLGTAYTIDSTDSIVGWTGNSTNTVTANTTTFLEGSGAINLNKNDNSNADAYFVRTIPATDMRNKFVSVWLYIRDAAALTKIGATTLFVGAPDYSWYMYKQTPISDLRIGWNIISIETANPSGMVGTPVLNGVTWVRFNVNTASAATTYGNGEIVMDRVALSAFQPNGVVYTGTWSTSTGGERTEGSSKEGTTGSTATFMFDGTAVNLIARKGPGQSIASIQVDSDTPIDVDLFQPTTAIYQQTVFTQTGLVSGPHTLKITGTGRTNPAATGLGINIDSFETGGPIDWTYDWVTNSFADGSHTIGARSIDAAGNISNTVNRTVTVDNTNPASTITYPAMNDAFTTDVGVTGSSTDTNFDRYELDYRYGNSTDDWIPITTGLSPVTNSSLGTWAAPTITPIYDWQTDGDSENWCPQQGITNISVTGGSLNGRTTGGAPYYIKTPQKLTINGNETKVLKIRMKVSDTSGYAKLFWKYSYPYQAQYLTVSDIYLPMGEKTPTTQEDEWGYPTGTGASLFGESRRMIKWPVVNPGQWVEYTIDMSLGKVWIEGDPVYNKNNPLMDYSQIWPTTGFWAGTVYQLRLDPSDAPNVDFNIDYFALGAADGNYNIRLRTFDKVGRSNATVTSPTANANSIYPVMIDRNDPACIISTPVNMTFLNSGTGVSVTGIAADDLVNGVASGVRNVEYRIIQNVDSFAPTVGPWQDVATSSTLTANTASVIKAGTILRQGTICANAADKNAFGGTWTGAGPYTLSADVTTGANRTLAGTMTVASGSILKMTSVLKTGTTCGGTAIKDSIGGSWSGTGPFTLTADRTLANDINVPASWSTSVTLPAGWHGIQARAFDRAGNSQESNYSYVTVDIDPPPVPRLRAMADRGRGGIILSWTPVKDAGSGIDYYVLYRANVPITSGVQYPDGTPIENADNELITRDFGAGSETFRAFHAANAIDTNYLPSATPTRYYIRAVDQQGNFSPKASISALYDNQPPTTPANLTATRTGGTLDAQLSWTPSTDNQTIAEYRIYRSKTPDFTPAAGNKVGTAQVTGTFFTTKLLDTNLEENTTYYYKVVAYDDSLIPSEASNEASVRIDNRIDYSSLLPHKTFSENSDQCVMCHRTHTGPGKNLLKRTYEADTCYTCHDGTGSNIPTKAQFDYAPSGLHRVKDEIWPTGALSCIDCHNPHLNTEGASFENFDDLALGDATFKTVTDGTKVLTVPNKPTGWTLTGGNWQLVGDKTQVELTQTDGAATSMATFSTGYDIGAAGGYFQGQFRFSGLGGEAYITIAGDGATPGNGVTLVLNSNANTYELRNNGVLLRQGELMTGFAYEAGTLYRIKAKLDETKLLNAKLYTVARSDLPTGHDVITDTLVGSVKYQLSAGDYKGQHVAIGTNASIQDSTSSVLIRPACWRTGTGDSPNPAPPPSIRFPKTGS